MQFSSKAKNRTAIAILSILLVFTGMSTGQAIGTCLNGLYTPILIWIFLAYLVSANLGLLIHYSIKESRRVDA